MSEHAIPETIADQVKQGVGVSPRRPVLSLIGLGVLGVAALATSAVSCGGADPFCGDGETDSDLGEECDDGNDNQDDFCRSCLVYLPPRTTVKWLFNADAAEGFVQDSCVDLRVSRVSVSLTGPMSATLDDMCPSRQVVFEDLPAGTYTASMTPLDVDGNALSGAIEQPVVVGNVDSEHTIVVPPDAWTGTYTGSFFFSVRWGGLDCTPAGVVDQSVRLTVNGAVVTQMTTAGRRLDGTAGACVPASEASPQTALTVPFGPATVVIEGVAAGGGVTYRGSFDTFVGAGTSNPTLQYDVPVVPDAGL